MAGRLESGFETLVGAAVLATAIGFGVYAAQSAGNLSAPDPDSMSLVARFSAANGVAPGTEVRIAGVKVGTVTDVSLDPKTKRAVVTMLVRSDLGLTDATLAVIDLDGLLGGSYLELKPGSGFDELASGDEIEHTQGSLSLVRIIGRIINSTGGDEG